MGIGQAFSVAAATDEDRAIATMTMAFSGDPVARWVWRGADRYLIFFPPFVRAFAGAAFGQGTADTVDNYCAVAMWLPPGVGSDEEEIDAVVAESIPVAEQDDVNALFEQMGEFHPTEDHWYLPLIGVDFASQSRGHGSGLLQHALERCDTDGLPAYLEATTPRNRALYARYAFEDLGVIQAGDSPPLWPMLRRPHGA